ncbi:MAG TPA: translation initiation factor IF-3 [Longimicrobiales bacterium]|nr:translation initiation factor IF-3 [Longimicrobiales bacterium]
MERVIFFAGRNGEPRIATEKRVRINRQIRITPVRVIADDGEQLGIMPVEQAIETAESQGLDLVEVAPNSRPPVVRIMDYGKFKYEAARKARQAKKKQHNVQLKEVKFRPGIEAHDLEFKLRHARRFLEEGDKVKATMMFRGRQVTHPELGREVLMRVAEELDDVGKVETPPRLEGRNMLMVLAPRK